jgi:hypothetical protein
MADRSAGEPPRAAAPPPPGLPRSPHVERDLAVAECARALTSLAHTAERALAQWANLRPFGGRQ